MVILVSVFVLLYCIKMEKLYGMPCNILYKLLHIMVLRIVANDLKSYDVDYNSQR